MNFKEATDNLFDRIDHAELAKALGVSVASIRQARLIPSARAYRVPPPNWQHAVIGLAEERVRHYRRLIQNMRRENA
jgi:hypothetical protein